MTSPEPRDTVQAHGCVAASSSTSVNFDTFRSSPSERIAGRYMILITAHERGRICYSDRPKGVLDLNLLSTNGQSCVINDWCGLKGKKQDIPTGAYKATLISGHRPRARSGCGRSSKTIPQPA